MLTNAKKSLMYAGVSLITFIVGVSFVFGISFLLYFLIFHVIALALAIYSIVIGLKSLSNKEKDKALAIIGTTLSVLVLFAIIYFFITLISGGSNM